MQAIKEPKGRREARIAAGGGWSVEGPRELVDALGRELLVGALVAAGRAELRTVWLYIDQRGETVRVELDHARRCARVETIDDGMQLVGIARAA